MREPELYMFCHWDLQDGTRNFVIYTRHLRVVVDGPETFSVPPAAYPEVRKLVLSEKCKCACGFDRKASASVEEAVWGGYDPAKIQNHGTPALRRKNALANQKSLANRKKSGTRLFKMWPWSARLLRIV